MKKENELKLELTKIPHFPMQKQDKETILFELGSIAGAAATTPNPPFGCLINDSCDVIKEIIDKY